MKKFFFFLNQKMRGRLCLLSLLFFVCIVANRTSCPASRYWTVFITLFQQRMIHRHTRFFPTFILPLSLSHLYNYYHCLCTTHGFSVSIQV